MRLLAVALMAWMALSSQAQFLRSASFMEGTPYRLQLNPALVPERGYINVPIVGMSGAAARSNVLSTDDVIDMFRNGDDDDYYATDKFYGKLR